MTRAEQIKELAEEAALIAHDIAIPLGQHTEVRRLRYVLDQLEDLANHGEPAGESHIGED